jgi:hypothetical protein
MLPIACRPRRRWSLWTWGSNDLAITAGQVSRTLPEPRLSAPMSRVSGRGYEADNEAVH